MYRKISTALFLLIILGNVFSATITTYDDATPTSELASCALLKGEFTREINEFETKLLEKVDAKLEAQNKIIEESTNPLRQSFPTIIFLAIMLVIWAILKAKGKV